jgi:hypothetical protein
MDLTDKLVWLSYGWTAGVFVSWLGHRVFVDGPRGRWRRYLASRDAEAESRHKDYQEWLTQLSVKHCPRCGGPFSKLRYDPEAWS